MILFYDEIFVFTAMMALI